MAKQKPTKHIVVVFNQEHNTVLVEPVTDSNADCVETENNLYHLKDAKTYNDTAKGGLVHVFNADLPAMVEAANLKMLRRSTALKRVMDFDKPDGKTDWVKFLPWVVIAMLIMFK